MVVDGGVWWYVVVYIYIYMVVSGGIWWFMVASGSIYIVYYIVLGGKLEATDFSLGPYGCLWPQMKSVWYMVVYGGIW